jgi:hypothetical protein
MHPCQSSCTCGLQLVLCEIGVVEHIQTSHREKYELPYPTPNNEWVARCRRCGRHYLLTGHNSPKGEKITLYPHFFYHTIISWNGWRRWEEKLKPVTLQEVKAFWEAQVPELSWDPAMVNAFEVAEEEFKVLAKRKRSFVIGASWADLMKDSPFRRDNDLALGIPALS